jgi:hypothetical protein
VGSDGIHRGAGGAGSSGVAGGVAASYTSFAGGTDDGASGGVIDSLSLELPFPGL